MTLPVSMIDPAPDDLIRDAPRHHWSPDTGTVTWPCPRCAATLTSPPPVVAGISRAAAHDCAHPHVTTPAKTRAAAERVAAWWAGYDAARETADPCRKNHVPDGATILLPADGPVVYLTTGGGDAYTLTDRMTSGDDVFGTAHPVLRAVLAARLAAMAALLAPTPEEVRP